MRENFHLSCVEEGYIATVLLLTPQNFFDFSFRVPRSYVDAQRATSYKYFHKIILIPALFAFCFSVNGAKKVTEKQKAKRALGSRLDTNVIYFLEIFDIPEKSFVFRIPVESNKASSLDDAKRPGDVTQTFT